MKLTFENYRRPFSTDPGAWSAGDTAQAEAICETEGWQDNLTYGASQHGFELNDSSDELYDAIAAAYDAATPTIEQVMDC